MKNNLTKIRKENNKTQADLSKVLHISEAAISKMENGYQRISDEQAVTLADFFGISIDHLLGREWHNPETTVYKTVDFDIKDVYRKLQTYSKTELIELRGAIDFILETKFTPGDNGQLIKNKIDELIKTK
jgi:transcriptional regulator with XRE-family HTH domain